MQGFEATRTLEERLNVIPRERLTPATEQRLRQLCRDLDRLARRDEDTQEVYVHEPTLRGLFRKHFPPQFAEGYLRMMKEGPDGHLLRNTRPGSRESVIPLAAAARAAGIVRPEDRPEAIGLTVNSSIDDVRRAFLSRVPDLPDSMFTPEIGDRLRRAVNHLDDVTSADPEVATQEVRALAPDYFDRVKTCFATRAGIWWEIATVAFLWFFFTIWPADPDPLSAVVAALILAGIFVVVWLLWSLVYCLVAAIFG
jgi:hypothetical protein